MVLEIPIVSFVVIENQTTGEFITFSIAGAAEPDMQIVAVGLPSGYRIRVEEAACTPSDNNLFACTNKTNSFKNIHYSSNGQRCQSEAANSRNLQNDSQRS